MFDYQNFLSIFDDAYDGYDDVFDETLPPVFVTESRGGRVKPRDGDIWYYRYPHYNGGRQDGPEKTRRILILNVEKYGNIVVMISSADEKRLSRYMESNYAYVLQDWKKYGLKNSSYVLGSGLRVLEKERLLSFAGRLEGSEYYMAKSKVELFLENRFSAMQELVAFLNFRYILDKGYTSNNRKFLDLDTMIKIRRGNCMDISNLVHQVAHKLQVPHVIVLSRYFKEISYTLGHVFTITQEIEPDKHNYYIFRYLLDPDPKKSDISTIFSSEEKGFKGAMLEEAKYMKKNHFAKIFGKDCQNQNCMLEARELEIWDRFIKSGKTQAQLLTYLYDYFDNKRKQEAYQTQKKNMTNLFDW